MMELQVYNLTLSVSDGGQSSNALLTVEITKQNIRSPIFLYKAYYYQHIEMDINIPVDGSKPMLIKEVSKQKSMYF